MDFTGVFDRFQDEETLGGLSLEQSKALVDLLILTVFADEEVTEEELEGLAEQWGQLPFAGDEALEDIVGEHGYETRAFLEQNQGDRAAFQEKLGEVAAQLTDDDVQEAALRMVAIVSQADGVDAQEVKMCHDLGDLFGFDEDRVADIIDEIYEAAPGVDADAIETSIEDDDEDEEA